MAQVGEHMTTMGQDWAPHGPWAQARNGPRPTEPPGVVPTIRKEKDAEKG